MAFKKIRLSVRQCVQIFAFGTALSSLLPLTLNAAGEPVAPPSMRVTTPGIAGGEELIAPVTALPDPTPAQSKVLRNQHAVPKPAQPKKTTATGEDSIISKLEFRQANMVDVVRALADMSGLNIVATEEAAKKTVTVFLQNISVKDALDTITKNSGLWYRQDKVSKTFRVMSTDEYQRDVVVYKEDTTRIFNLLHPNPTEVAMAILALYPLRIMPPQLCDAGEVRGLGRGGAGGGMGGMGGMGMMGGGMGGMGMMGGMGGMGGMGMMGGGMGGMGMGGMGMGGMGMGGMGMGGMGMGGMGGMGGMRGGMGGMGGGMGMGMNNPFSNRVGDAMTPDQLQTLGGITLNRDSNVVTSEDLSKLGTNEPLIFLSVNCEHNLLILRTSDNEAIKDIEYLIKEMDRPVPQVLLEMRILELSTGNTFEQLFDLNYQSGDQTKGPGVFSTALPALPAGAVRNANNLTLGAGTLVFQFLSDRINAKIQLLQTRNNVKTISSPVLLASNNRKSELFVGTQNLITTGFNPGTVVTPANGTPVTVAPTPITELQDVGPKLTIVPKINADKTVTIEIDQTVTSVIRNLSQVLVPDAAGNLTQQFVDGLDVATIKGIVTAKDGLTVAIGGLIRNNDSKVDISVPILSSIPLFGELFRSRRDVSTRTEMVLLITPRIMYKATESDDLSRDVVEPLTEHEW